MNTVEIYQKLKPFLRVKVLHKDRNTSERFYKNNENRNIFDVQCTRNYLWGHFYACLEWNPNAKARILDKEEKNYVVGVPPTYEQFCLWLGEDPELAE